MRDGWREVPLLDLMNLQNGYPFKPKDLGAEGLPVVRIKELMNPRVAMDRSTAAVPESMHLDSGDVVFSWSGRLEAVRWDRGPALLNQHLFKVTPTRSDVTLDFILVLLQHLIPSLHLHGTTMKHVTKTELKRWVVSVPPRDEQRRIVDLIGSLDDTIAAAERQVSSLQMTLVELTMLWTAPGTDEDAPLEDVCDILDRLRRPVNEKERTSRQGDVPYYGANGQVGTIDESIFDEPLVLLWEDGGPVQEFRSRQQAYRIDGPAWVNNHAHVLRARDVPTDWLYYSLRHRDLRMHSSVGTRSKITQAQMRQIPIRVASEMKFKAVTMAGVEVAGGRARSELDRLRELRSNLLTALLSGEHQIPESYDELMEDQAA